MSKVTTVDSVALYCLFKNFNEAVNRKEYEKMSYPLWKELNKQLGEAPAFSRVQIFSEEDKIYFTLGSAVYNFYFKDKSFGTFLSEHIPFSGKCDIGELNSEQKDMAKMYYSDGTSQNVYNVQIKKNNNENLVWNTNSNSGIPTTIGSKLTTTYSGFPTYTDKTVSVSDMGYTITDRFDPLEKRVEKLENQVVDKKDKEKNMNFNFDFGPVESNDLVRFSPYGIAIRNTNGEYVSYDANKGELVNVDVFNFDCGNLMYKMPVALKDVSAGDVVIHNHKPMFVVKMEANNTLQVIDFYLGESKLIIPTTNMFGFNFVTEVVSLIDVGHPSEDNPFGNILPFILMNNSKDKNSSNTMAMAMMASNMSAGNMNFGMNNPMMMLMALNGMGENKDHSMIETMLMMQMFNSKSMATPAEHNNVQAVVPQGKNVNTK